MKVTLFNLTYEQFAVNKTWRQNLYMSNVMVEDLDGLGARMNYLLLL